MTQKEEKWYLLSMKLRYFMASFFSFVLLFSGLAFFVWLLELFITIGPWMNLTLAILDLCLSAYFCPRILRISVMKHWLSYDLSQR